MPINCLMRGALITTLVLTMLGCDDGPTEPSAIGTPPALNLTGTWVGPFGPPQTTVVFRATWTAVQTGNALSGTIAMFRSTDNVAFNGTMTGTLSGTRLSLRYAVPRGSVPGAADCVISGTGTLDATATLLSGTLTVLATNCEAIPQASSSVDEIALVKQ